MASVVVTDSYRDVQVRSQTDVRDVQVVTFISQPSGAQLFRAIPYQEWISDPAHLALSQTADAVENIIAGGQAIAAQGVEDLDPFGLSVYLVEFLVQAPPQNPLQGTLQTTVLVPVDTLTLDIQFGGVSSYYTGQVQTPLTGAEIVNQAYQALLATGQTTS
jgi:hypothetical protein